MKSAGAKPLLLSLLSCTVWLMGHSWATASEAPLEPSRTIDKLTAVQVLERDSRKPLAGLSIEVVATKQIWCIQAPCPQGKQKKWTGVTDTNGVLRFPASLADANDEVYFHVVGTDAYGSVLGHGKRDAHGNEIVLLTHSRLAK